MAADRSPRRAAVLGSPISHSLSPALHQAGYAAAGLSDWSYVAVEVSKSGLAGVVSGMDQSWRGLSLTMPLKEVALDLAIGVSDVARTARAANTLVRRDDGGWDADNTDVHGIVESLRAIDHGGHAVVVGAGATARSAVLALAQLGVRRLDITARRPTAAGALAGFAAEQGLDSSVVPLEQWASGSARLLVSTVPVDAAASLVAAIRPDHSLERTVFDVVYSPWPSPLAAAVWDVGGVAVSGLEMLIHQAARQFELFTGVTADIDALRAAVRERV